MTFWPFLQFFAAITYIYLAAYVLFKNPRGIINWACMGTSLCFAVWSAQRVFISSPLVPLEEVSLIMRTSSAGWIFFSSFYLWFVLIFTQRERILKSKFFYAVIIGIPLVFTYQEYAKGSLISNFLLTGHGWHYLWEPTSWTYLFFIYYISCSLISLYLYMSFWRRTKSISKKNISKIMFSLLLLGLASGSVTDIFLPLFKVYAIPQMGNIFALAWVVALAYAIKKYELLEITPSLAADEIISKMGDSLILLDESGKITIVNNAALKLLKYQEKEIIGKGMDLLFSAHSMGKLGIEGKGFLMLLESTPIKNWELTYVTKLGDRVPVLVSGSIVKDSDQKIIGAIIVARDIAQIKKTQERLEKMNVRLKTNESAVLNILSDLKRANEDLRSSQDQLVQTTKLASLGRLVSDMAHEVNNPLMIISGRAQLAAMGDVSPEEIRENLSIIKDQCDRAKDIIQRLLLFSKPSRGEIREVNVNNVIEFVIKLLEHQYSLSNIKFSRNYSEGLPLISMDEKLMHEVFMNIIKNSAEAMPEGGDINISTSKEDRKVRIDITDTGHGMTKEALAKVFDPFFTTKEMGTGLGLSVCYGIINAHGGELKYKSELGRGTIATIYLPINQ